MSAPKLAAAGVAAIAAYFGYQQMNPAVPVKNQAFVFVKPHAVTDSVNTLVRDSLAQKGITIKSEGELTSEVIDEKKLIDQHYYAIASKATILKPAEMNVPEDKFKAQFGVEWKDVMAKNQAFNALDACKELNVSATELGKLYGACKKQGKLVKLGGGFYCAQITHKGKTIYCFNGFFMDMRNAFTAPGLKIHYYDVEWDPKDLSWADFRGKVLGPTDPAEAPKDSLRGLVMADWKKLGLKSEPNVGDNAVHASASPFEGLAERMNWLSKQCGADDYCQAMVKAGIPESRIQEWTRDPQVPIEEGKKKSLFDSLEDMDAAECLLRAKALSDLSSK
jgi:nucleoside diphosphate kinase